MFIPFKYDIYDECLDTIDRFNFVVCAIFTATSNRYFAFAKRLKLSCEKYSLPFRIYSVPEIHKSVSPNGTEDSSYTKSNFILFNIDRFPDKGILYTDIDMVFIDKPVQIFEIIDSGFDFAIYNWLSDEHNESYMPILREDTDGNQFFSEFYRYSHRIDFFDPEQLICSGGVQLYSNSAPAVHFLKNWQYVIEQNPGSSDDECLDFTFNNLDDAEKPKAFWTDKSYMRLPWWPHVKPVILHTTFPEAGIGRSLINKSLHKRRFYHERCRRKTDHMYFPSDHIIDTRKNLLMKFEGRRLIDARQIEQQFWIYPEGYALD